MGGQARASEQTGEVGCGVASATRDACDSMNMCRACLGCGWQATRVVALEKGPTSYLAQDVRQPFTGRHML